jgi:hypothetical protein
MTDLVVRTIERAGTPAFYRRLTSAWQTKQISAAVSAPANWISTCTEGVPPSPRLVWAASKRAGRPES